MRQAAVKMRLQIAGDLAVSEFGDGVMSAEAFEAMHGVTMTLLGGALPSVFLADFRRPLWALKAADLDAYFNAADAAVYAPAALVVAEAYLPLFRAHAWNVAQGGIIRKVFTDYASASRWCQMRLQLHRQAQTAP